MESITLRELQEATKGVLLGPCRDGDIVLTGAESDNRRIAEGNVFFAFPGERADGHDFVEAAFAAGAAGCVITKDPGHYRPDRFYLLVPDAVRAYGDLARYYRSLFDIPVVAVTGSVGKTTTKEMIAAVLAQEYTVCKTEGNFNNDIGLPRMVLTIDRETQVAVLEMGMNHRGEISYLTGIARPTLAVITNIGDAHIGNLGSREAIYEAKCEIFEGLSPSGVAVLNADDDWLLRLREEEAKRGERRLLYVGEDEGADLRATQVEEVEGEELHFVPVAAKAFSGEMPAIAVPAPGRHMLYPALMAAAVGRVFGLSYAQIAQGIREYSPTGMRMQKIALPQESVLFNDTYNANPQSMKAGLQALAAYPGERRVAVLGDMRELGDMEEILHREVGEFAAGLSLDALIAVGEASRSLAEAAREAGMTQVSYFSDKEAAKDAVRAAFGPHTAFLFKASRGMALEELVEDLRRRLREEMPAG